MINWETYKSMTAEQKEEYNFKFKDEPIFSVKSYMSTFITLYSIMMVQLGLIYIIKKDEIFINLYSSIDLLMINLILFSKILFIFLGGLICIDIFSFIFKLTKEHYWFKKNNIKKINYVINYIKNKKSFKNSKENV